VSERDARYLTAATSGPYVLSITEVAATELPWEQSFADTPRPPPLNREQRRKAQRKKR